MPLEIIRNDITKMKVDAIVNSTDSFLGGSGGTDKQIHLAAGKALYQACQRVGACEVGEAKITKGFDLPAHYVIHTVGPMWTGGNNQEEKLLANCYTNALLLAMEYKLETVAFPLISSGTFGYPRDKALHVAIKTIGNFLLKNELTVYLVVYDKKTYQLSEALFSSIKLYITGKYVQEKQTSEIEERKVEYDPDTPSTRAYSEVKSIPIQQDNSALDELINNLEVTFSQSLLKLIDEKGMTDAETYHKANIDRRLFSKIRNDPHYHASKVTVIAFAIALELNINETIDLLGKAGFALSHSNKFDIIIEYFIERENYNIFEINEALFAFEQKLLGV